MNKEVYIENRIREAMRNSREASSIEKAEYFRGVAAGLRLALVMLKD